MHSLQQKHSHILSQYIFLSYTIETLEHEHQILHQSTQIKLPDAFIHLIEDMLIIAKQKRRLLKEEMSEQHLSAQSLGTNDVFTSFLFILDKKEERRDFFNPAIRKKVESMIIELKHELEVKSCFLYKKPHLHEDNSFSHIS